MKKFFWALIILAIELCIVEAGARLFLRHTTAGKKMSTQSGFSYDQIYQLPGFPGNELEWQADMVGRLPSDLKSGMWTSIRQSEWAAKGPLFVLTGGSAPYGHEVDYSDTFWGRLGAAAPNATLLNLALPMSHVQQAGAQVRSAIERLKAKAVFVYIGDNEWNGFSYPRLARGSPLLQADAALLSLDFYRVLTYGVKSALFEVQSYQTLKPRDESFWFGLSDYCLRHPYRETGAFGAADVRAFRERQLEIFSRHINLMAQTAARGGAQLVLLTTPIHYRLSPCWTLPQFISERLSGTPDERTLEASLNNAYEALDRKQYDEARAILEQSAALDPDSALLNYYLAYALEGLGDIPGARRHFLLSRRMMVGSGGSIDQFNEIMRQKAQDGVMLVDLERGMEEFAAREGRGLGDAYFMDWCHPNSEGHRVLSEILKPAVSELSQK